MSPLDQKVSRPPTRFQEALRPSVSPQTTFCARKLRSQAFFADSRSLVFHGDAAATADVLVQAGVKANCIVTSPPFFGQRDYGVDGQIGLELHPSEFIAKLVAVFRAYRDVLADTGSLWVNLGDTYWSGKGEHRSGESKQSARRFGLRPQDRTGDGRWCRPKQLLLIPHRFAIAMQDDGWLVRNDNVWVKPNPIPDQVNDRCSMSHEYVFHFVKERWYYFDREAVGRPSSRARRLPPLDTWSVPPARGNGSHRAAFSEELIDIPIRATTPKGTEDSPAGIVLDPFVGSGTSVGYALKLGYRAIGVDLKKEFCELTAAVAKEAKVPQASESAHENILRGQSYLDSPR